MFVHKSAPLEAKIKGTRLTSAKTILKIRSTEKDARYIARVPGYKMP